MCCPNDERRKALPQEFTPLAELQLAFSVPIDRCATACLPKRVYKFNELLRFRPENSPPMLRKYHRTRSPAAGCRAKRYWVLQSAVAFWSVFFGFAIGCRRANSVIKYQVASSSMAPTWFGPHLTATCSHCGQQSPVVHEAYDPLVPTRCFSCGAICNCADDLQAGEVIEIFRRDASHPLKRFDVVAFDSPEHDEVESSHTLKRVWALPGEHIELRDGKAWINGKQLQKSAQELASVCLPLSRFPKDVRSHWWLVGAPHIEPIRIEVAANQSYCELEPSQRLEFRYVRPSRIPETPQMIPSPIADDFPFNQNSIAQFHEVSNYMLAIELVKPILTPWFVCMQAHGKQFRIRIGSNGDGSRGQVKTTVPEMDESNRLMIALCDDRLLAATEKRAAAWNLVDLEAALEPGSSKLALITITTSEPLEIKRLLIARDQWLGPRENRLTEWKPLGTNVASDFAEGYFVLGDNLQLSLDSRDSTLGRIASDRITGLVKRLEDSPEWILSLLDHAFRAVDGSQRHSRQE